MSSRMAIRLKHGLIVLHDHAVFVVPEIPFFDLRAKSGKLRQVLVHLLHEMEQAAVKMSPVSCALPSRQPRICPVLVISSSTV